MGKGWEVYRMKALSVRQPWANMLVYGHKSIEIRSWRTHYRGPLLICAGKKIDRDAYIPFFLRAKDQWDPRGVAVGTVNLADCRSLVREDGVAGMFREEDFMVGRHSKLFAWIVTNPRRLAEPFAVKGQLSLFDVDVPQGVLT